jgi:hypothetical protein
MVPAIRRAAELGMRDDATPLIVEMCDEIADNHLALLRFRVGTPRRVPALEEPFPTNIPEPDWLAVVAASGDEDGRRGERFWSTSFIMALSESE